MKSAPSDAFRRLCLAMALVATNWALPRSAHADAYGLQTVKNVVDTLKPNVLVVLESAESMQDLPGENAARYNEVGADCEEGNRSCRLTNQVGRWNHTGMGSQGIKFGDPNASCTATVTNTLTNTDNVVVTDTFTATATNTNTNAHTDSNTGTVTNTNTHTQTNTNTTTKTQTNSSTNTITQTLTNTNTTTSTFTTTSTNTTTSTATTSDTQTKTNTTTNTATSTRTNTTTSTNTGTTTVTNSGTQTKTSTITGTVTTTKTSTVTVTNSSTWTASHTGTNTSIYGPSRYEAENFTTKSTGSNENWPPEPNVWALWGNGYIEQAWVWLPLGTMTITVRAKGDTSCGGAGGGYAHFVVYARYSNGNPGSWTLGNAYTTGTYQSYNFSFSPPVAENFTFQIAFDNDAACSGSDRNLYVDYLDAGGSAIWPYTDTVTNTTTSLGTGTNTTTTTNTSTNTTSGTNTGTATATQTLTSVGTGTSTGTLTGTQTQTSTGTGTSAGNCATTTINYEAENLTYSGSPGTVVSYEGADSNGAQIQTSGTPAVDSYLQFTLTGVAAGSYDLSFKTKKWNTRGIVQVSIDGTNVGTPVDLYKADPAEYQAVVPVGSTTLTAGSHTIRFTVTSKNAASSGYHIPVDTITLGGTSAACTGTTTTTYTSVGTATDSSTATGTTVSTATASATATSTSTTTSTVTGTGTYTLTGTNTNTSASTSTDVVTVTVTNSSTRTDTDTSTSTETAVQVYACGSVGSVDLPNCTLAVPTTTGYCNQASGVSCSSDASCTAVKGDFCRYVATTDGSGRLQNETCVTSSGSPWGSCKHGVVTPNTTCTSPSDTSCATALAGDFCTEGQPAKMCADSGLWCNTAADCPGDATTDLCVPATSRMMMSKQALRRAVTDYADKVNFGFMNTYQGRGIPATATDASTAIYPYVKLQSVPSSANVTETKLLTRGELEKAGCFSLSSGPTSSCTIDYGGNGAINATASWNQITYTKVGLADSRWVVPRGDGRFDRISASWSSCSSSTILPACVFSGQGTGLYEGSYYTFSYKQGTPIPNGGVDGEGSRAHPVYFTTYRGKYFTDGTYSYNAVDTDRTDIINDGIYGRPAYTGTPYDSANEVPVPWSGSNNTAACDATTGASWNPAAVPMLSSADSATFGSKSVDRSQRALMIAARLEKASFGGVDATGTLAPLGCALNNEGASDANHSAAAYMSTVRANDVSANSNHTPCWSNNIVLVVDGVSNGYGDMDGTGAINCASTECAYNQATNPSLTGCNCAAITKAYDLARSGIQTHVVVNAPVTWSVRYPYTYAFLWNLAVVGSLDFTGKPSFGTTPEELYKKISDKIAAAAYPFMFTTGVPVAGATTQDPNSLILTQSNLMYDTSVAYPSWQGNVRAFDTNGTMQWNALDEARLGHPASWTDRRIYFATSGGTKVKVDINSDGSIGSGSKSALYAAGLGSSATEAEHIMQWLLGKPEMGCGEPTSSGVVEPKPCNPAPLMGAPTLSTPIVVGQGASNGLNGSPTFSTNTWKRPQLVYVGGDDGMLHAFFATTTAVGHGGEEAFAFIPNDMLPVITKQYAQGRQHLSADKGKHIFGLASSPKVKDMCIGPNCQNSDGSDWRTVLFMTEGPGGNKPFALDITYVIRETTGLDLTQLQLLWQGTSSTWSQSLGETTSLPGFYFAGYNSGAADNRILIASGYGTSNQGLVLVNADAATGTIKDTRMVGTSGGCSQRHTVMSDVGIARDYSSAATSQNLLGAYVSDTWGDAYQYVPGAATPLAKLYSLGCTQPLYFSPAVVQLDRAPKNESSAKGFIYLVQVTNSNLDPATALSNTVDSTNGFPGSELVVTKLDGHHSPPTIDTSYNSLNGSGQIVLSTDATTAANRICLQSPDGSGGINSFTDNAKTKTQTCSEAGGTELPATARPVGTPLVILRGDGLGFQAITSWYDWTARTNDCSSGSQFNYGKSYVTVHEFGADGTWYQIAGIPIDNMVITGIAFVGAGLFVDGINGAAAPQGLNIGETFSNMQQIRNASALERYARTSWTERAE